MSTAAECPRCGWNGTSTTTVAKVLPQITHNPVIATDEIVLLEDQVRILDEEISRLIENKAAILRRINSARSATRNLPPEILPTIFQFVSPPFDFIPPFASEDLASGNSPPVCNDLNQCNVAAVSHAWRQVANSTPQLWASLSIRIDPHDNDSALSLLDQFSENVGHFPMSIELDFTEQETPWPEDILDSLYLIKPVEDAVFVKHADKIQSLRLIDPPSEWLYMLEKLSQCVTLAVQQPSTFEEEQDTVDLTALLSLRHVILVYPRSTFLLPRSSITTLHLSSVPCFTSMELLINCPNLVEFESHPSPIWCDRPTSQNVVNDPITLHQLQHLTWNTTHSHCVPFVQEYIGQLRFPKLRALQYGDHCCYSSRGGRDHRLEFFSNLPMTLSSLTFRCFTHKGEGPILKDLLSSIPYLRELHLTDSTCKAECIKPVINAIGRPVVPLSENGEQQEASLETSRRLDQTFLPHLSKLSVKSRTSRLDGNMFVDMLEALHASGKNPKKFELVLHKGVDWNQDSQRRLQSLLLSGFRLSVV